MRTFSDQVVLITGASSGIGAALAREFARQGADVALVARRAERLDALAAEIRQGERRALPLPGDVAEDGVLEPIVQRTLADLGRLDVVVANAGFGVVGRVDELSLEDYRRQFETNVFGVLRTVQASVAALARARGRLVLIGSVAGYVSMPNASAYAMSKFAIRALAQALRHELAPAVSVTLISPGFIESEIRRVDNRGVYHANVRDPIPKWLVLSAEAAARQIVRGVARRRREVVVSAHGRAIALAARHVPWLVEALMSYGRIRSRREPT